jgi:hypothetical protein
MIEISFTEMILFTWGIIATGFALKHKHDTNIVKSILQHIIVDPHLYSKLRDGWKREQCNAS